MDDLQLFTWLSLVMSLMASFCAVFLPRDVLDENWDFIESVSEGFSYLLILKTCYVFCELHPFFRVTALYVTYISNPWKDFLQMYIAVLLGQAYALI